MIKSMRRFERVKTFQNVQIQSLRRKSSAMRPDEAGSLLRQSLVIFVLRISYFDPAQCCQSSSVQSNLSLEQGTPKRQMRNLCNIASGVRLLHAGSFIAQAGSTHSPEGIA